jgi:hypothetical protein
MTIKESIKAKLKVMAFQSMAPAFRMASCALAEGSFKKQLFNKSTS